MDLASIEHMFWGELAEVLDGVVPVTEAADQTLLDTARKIETARRRLDAVQALVVGELDVRGTTDISDGLATGRWLSREAGISDHAAGGLVRVARALRVDLPATAGALGAGVIGFEHANVMTDAVNPRIVSAFREIETELIDQAGGMAFRAWRDHVRTVAALLDQDGGYDPDDDVYSNRLSVRGSSEGTDVSGRLVGPAAVTVREAIEQTADELYKLWAADADASGGEIAIPSRASLRALALEELCRRATIAGAGGRFDDEPLPEPEPEPEPEPGDDLEPNADGTATQPVATPAAPAAPAVPAGGRVCSGCCVGRSTARSEATLVFNWQVPDIVYDRFNVAHRRQALGPLMCDLDVGPVILDALGVPLDLGRTERFFTRDQRRALARRDGGCVFPGCGALPHRCDAHHVVHWIDGGPTDVAAGVLLCRRHHGVVHRTGWAIHIGDDGWAWITTAWGRKHWCQQHQKIRPGPAPPPAQAA